MEKIKVFVACHKQFEMPVNDACFQPIHVGAKNSDLKIENAIRDDTGDNISEKNSIYCELTGLYWIWKNYKNADYIGLCHYRRFFSKNAYSIKDDYSILKSDQLLNELQGFDIILPSPFKKSIENHFYKNDSDYKNDKVFIEITSVLKTLYPEYLQAAIKVIKNKEMSFGNIMLTSRNLFDQYCEWLFSVEFYLEKFIVEKYGEIEPREMGFISEWLLNIWVLHNKLKVKYIPVCMINNESIYKRLIKKVIHTLR